MKSMWNTFVAGLVIGIAGCATSHVMIGTARPAISPDQVKIYFHPPEVKYEEIAMLDTSSQGAFAITAQGKTDAVINRLKAEAAKLGANGVLLQGVSDQSGGSVGSGFGQAQASGNSVFGSSIGFSGNIKIKAGSGVAIYVESN